MKYGRQLPSDLTLKIDADDVNTFAKLLFDLIDDRTQCRTIQAIGRLEFKQDGNTRSDYFLYFFSPSLQGKGGTMRNIGYMRNDDLFLAIVNTLKRLMFHAQRG